MNTANKISSNSLAPPKQLLGATQGTISAFQSITNTENQITALQVSEDSILPSLATHVQATKDTANYWFKTVQPAILTTLNSIVEFGSSFDSIYLQLSNNAAIIQQNNSASDAAKLQFKAEISNLLSLTDTVYLQSTRLQTTITAFQEKTNTDSRNLAGDLSSEQTKIAADENQISLYEEQMKTLQKQLRKAKKEKETLDNPFVIIATLGISQIVSAIENLDGKINTLQKEINQIYGNEQKENQELAALTNLVGSLSVLIGLTSQLDISVMVFTSSWQSLSNNLKELEGMENISPDDSWIESDLEAINLEWAAIAKLVSAIQ